MTATKRGSDSTAREAISSEKQSGPTPIPTSGRTWALLLAGAFSALAFVAWAAPAVPLVALDGFALALVLSFPVRLLSRLVPRGPAVAAAFLGLAVLAALALWVLLPMLGDQLEALFGAAPGLVADAQRTLRGLLEPLAERGLLPGAPDDLLADLSADFSSRAQGLAEGLLGGLVGFVPRAFELAVGLLATLVVAAYMLADGRKMKAAYLRVAPKGYCRDARELWDAFGLSFSRYLSGLLFVMAVQGVLSALALWATGVPYAAALGAWVALTAVVPLIGAWVGAVPGVLVALSVSPAAALVAAFLFLAIQQLEGNVLTPRVMGGALGVHPILILLGVIGAGQLAGPNLVINPGFCRVLGEGRSQRPRVALPRAFSKCYRLLATA